MLPHPASNDKGRNILQVCRTHTHTLTHKQQAFSAAQHHNSNRPQQAQQQALSIMEMWSHHGCVVSD